MNNNKSVAIVTGASQGIGRAIAVRLAHDFEAVVLAARQEDELKKPQPQSKPRAPNRSLTRSISASPTRPKSWSSARWIVSAESTLC